jgi:alpha-1,6-mannosyltransferase
MLLGLGDHTQAILDVMQPVGTLIGSAIALIIMWQCWQRRINPILGLGMAMGAFVLLAPVIQPWYLLWAALPLAAATADPRYRKATIWLTVLFSVTIMPNGATIPVYVIVQAVVVAAVVVGATYLLLRRAGLLPQTQPAPDEPDVAALGPAPTDPPPIDDTATVSPATNNPATNGPATNDTADDAGSTGSAAYPRSL